MTAYIAVAPIAAAFAERLPRRAMLVSLDLVRALVALALPFVTEVWQIYVLILFSSQPRRRSHRHFRQPFQTSCRMKTTIPAPCRYHVSPMILKVSPALCSPPRC